MKTLREVKIGETVKVVKLHGEGPVKRRIMDMGISGPVTINLHLSVLFEAVLKW